MINFWIRKVQWKGLDSNDGHNYFLFANDSEIAKFKTKEDALLFQREFNSKIEEI